jgi:uncharacterized membrane protein affecting hemolysin expression
MVELTPVNHDDDDAVLLNEQTENRMVLRLTSKKFITSLELVKLVLLFIICIIVGVSLSRRSHNTTTPASTDAPATPVVPTEQNSTRYEYRIEFTLQAELEQKLNQLTDEGWILDQAFYEPAFLSTNQYRHMWYLKRPK